VTEGQPPVLTTSESGRCDSLIFGFRASDFVLRISVPRTVAMFATLRVLIVLALLATIASTLRVYPHQLAYFNEGAGGPGLGDKCLLGSNLDWGQDVLFLIDWQIEHPQLVDGSYYLLHSSYDPKNLGLRSTSLHDVNACDKLVERIANGEVLTLLLSKQFLLERPTCISVPKDGQASSAGACIFITRMRALDATN
jgi:hypothetical protein